MTSIEKILDTKGPLMSNDLSTLIEKLENINYNTASQRVARNKKIFKIKGFFVSNLSLCYLEKHIDDGLLFDSLNKAMFENGRKYWYTLNALELHGGIINQKFLECYTNYPVVPLKGHLPFNKIIEKFIKSNILNYNSEYYYISPKLKRTNYNSLTYKTIEAIKDNILTDFGTLNRNIGFISYNTAEKYAEFGKFRWAFKGVSNITGLMQGSKPGFILADVIVGTSINEKDVSFFIEKIKHIQSFNNASRIVPYLIVDDLSREALIALKFHGIAIGFIKELFGQKYADTLKELISVLNNAGASLKSSPEKYLDLIKELKKYNEGLANNIRGALFEFVVGHIHSLGSNNSIDLGREIYENDSRHEMDVLAIYSDKIVIAECKAKRSKIDLKTIDKWLGEKIPAFRKWIEKQEIWKNKKIEFEFWSTGGFTDDALEKLEYISSSVSKYKVLYYEPNDIRKRALSMKNKKLKEALNDFFLKTKV
ncbi:MULTISPECIES: hypothetical protein [Leeuwenhoekiella]|uniref:hypothetical protein n=2 Tax=Flavobacteriaceae TaxID=49546 RepID=UPI000C559AF5|nr:MULTISPECIES: hypothetical protein [Leeuwenhoekiella]MAO44104.1 hypothetical protein [Leeuwenhoekiella sp.]|tara:strand:- start:295 stop:1737 length:1443 start_codon:yes stop_codon:yes gene_type:complete